MTENLTQWKSLFFIAMSSLNFFSSPPFFFLLFFLPFFFLSSCKRSHRIFNYSLRVMCLNKKNELILCETVKNEALFSYQM